MVGPPPRLHGRVVGLGGAGADRPARSCVAAASASAARASDRDRAAGRRAGHRHRPPAGRSLGRLAPRLNVRMRLGSTEAVKQWVKAGLGASIGARRRAREGARRRQPSRDRDRGRLAPQRPVGDLAGVAHGHASGAPPGRVDRRGLTGAGLRAVRGMVNGFFLAPRAHPENPTAGTTSPLELAVAPARKYGNMGA